jgi:hypothetical protein
LDRDQPLTVFLAALPEWKTVYKDNVSVLLVRKNLPIVDASKSIRADSVEQAAHLQ